MLAVALVENLAAFLVFVLRSEHSLQEIGVVVLVITDGGRMVLNDFLVFVLHQLLTALKDTCTAQQIPVHPVETAICQASSVELVGKQ